MELSPRREASGRSYSETFEADEELSAASKELSASKAPRPGRTCSAAIVALPEQFGPCALRAQRAQVRVVAPGLGSCRWLISGS